MDNKTMNENIKVLNIKNQNIDNKIKVLTVTNINKIGI